MRARSLLLAWLVLVPLLAATVADASCRGCDPAAAFRVPDLLAQAQAEDGVAAKQKAFQGALARGLQKVMRRMTLSRDHARLPTPSADAVLGYAAEMQVAGEQVGANSYEARLTVTYDAAKLRALLGRAGIVHFTATPGTMLVIPLLAAGSGYDWADAALRSGFAEIGETQDLVSIHLASGGAEDRSYDVGRLVAGDAYMLELFRMRYRANGVAVVVARESAERDGLELELAGTDLLGPFAKRLSVKGLRGAPRSASREAAERIAALLEDRWKSAMRRDSVAREAVPLPDGSQVLIDFGR
jgi:hypothetical protein